MEQPKPTENTGARGPRGPRGPVAWLIRFCLEQKLLVILAVGLLVVWGLIVAPFEWKLGGLLRKPVPVDAIPDTGENQQIVFTKWPGHSPQDVQDQITFPLTSALLGMPDVRTIRASSMFGFSSIYIIFNEQVGFYDSRSRVLEKLNSLPPKTLPEGVRPALGPDATALGQIFWYTLEGQDERGNPVGGWDLQELRSIQDWRVRFALLASTDEEGNKPIAEVASVGGFVKEYQIDVDPDAMRHYGVTLDEVFRAVRMSNVDVGARTIELNRAEYVVRGLGFIKSVADIEKTVIKANENIPVYIRNVARFSLGPALRRGALDKEGAEAVGGVVVVRYGENPLSAIKAVKKKIAEIEPSLPEKRLADGTLSRVRIVPFYDRTGLIRETLGTLRRALSEEIFVTIIVVIVMLLHLRSSVLISGMLPLAVLICFIAMKHFGVDANVVALSGIAIAIGTIVDMGIIVSENILRHLERAPPEESRLDVVHRAASEVGGAILTAILTTVVGFLPVFTMTGAGGKLFRPLAWTKTFALIASVVIALTMIPVFAQLLFPVRIKPGRPRQILGAVLVLGGIAAAVALAWWAGLVMIAFGGYALARPWLPEVIARRTPLLMNGLAVVVVGVILTRHWLPLGPERGLARNLIFVGLLVGGILGFFRIFERAYGPLLRWCLAHKTVFMAIPAAAVLFGLYVWWGPGGTIQKLKWLGEHRLLAGLYLTIPVAIFAAGLYVRLRIGMSRANTVLFLGVVPAAMILLVVPVWTGLVSGRMPKSLEQYKGVEYEKAPDRGLRTYVKWMLANDWDGRGKEFMPPLDEGSFLLMPVTMSHASIGEALDVLQTQDAAIQMIPEVESAVGKIGRAESPLDPAPISMIETVINYKSEYITDASGHRLRFRYDHSQNDVFRDARGREVLDKGRPIPVKGRYFWKDGSLIADPGGRPFRQWRPRIKSPRDIWAEIEREARVPGTTVASFLQPMEARRVMLQSGMRAKMGIKVRGQHLRTIEQVGLDIERLLKSGAVPAVKTSAVIADRIVGKPYIELEPDREAIARYGVHMRKVQDVIEVALGGRRVTTTVEGRERYPVRVRYLRELRDTVESLGRILVPAADGSQIPLAELLVEQAEIELDREAARERGVSPKAAAEAILGELRGRGVEFHEAAVPGFPISIRRARDLEKQAADLDLRELRIAGTDGELVPVRELVRLSFPRGPWYRAGPMVIKSEDIVLVGYVLFDKKPGYAEVDAVEAVRDYLEGQEDVFKRARSEASERAAGEGRRLTQAEIDALPGLNRRGCSYEFAGEYENQLRAQKTLMLVVPLALFIIFIILYFQFKAVSTTFFVFSGIVAAWAGGLIMLWLYAQPWFLNFSLFGAGMRDLFQIHTVNLSTAVWVGFLALFGIASDNGVVMATYLDQSFKERGPRTIAEIREATVAAGLRRIRPCLMTTATTILALIPILTSTGRGADVMVPMAIPSFGGMIFALITIFIVPVLYSWFREMKLGRREEVPPAGQTTPGHSGAPTG